MECLRGGFRRTISAFNTLRLSLFCRLSGGKKKTPTRYINWRAVEGRCRRRHSDVKFLRISSDRGKCPHTRARARKLLPHLPPSGPTVRRLEAIARAAVTTYRFETATTATAVSFRDSLRFIDGPARRLEDPRCRLICPRAQTVNSAAPNERPGRV